MRVTMRNLDKRLSALEAYVEIRVEEGLRRELEAALEILEERLTREEFERVARILAEMGGEE
jgi:DNA-binding LytR/AlgR family response regulator